MLSLQKTITYDGIKKNAPVKNIQLEFKMPIYQYGEVDIPGGTEIVRRITNKLETKAIAHAINSTTYRVDLDENFITGKSEREFHAYSLKQLGEGKMDNLVVRADVNYLVENNCKIGDQSLELIYFPKFDFDTLTDTETNPSDLFKRLIIINKEPYFSLLEQIQTATTQFKEELLWMSISLLTDLDGTQPTRVISQELEKYLIERMTKSDINNASEVLTIITDGFNSLHDFPLTIPEIKTLNIGGTFTITASEGTEIVPRDWMFYSLTAEDSDPEGGDSRILHFAYSTEPKIQDNSAKFRFSDSQPILQNCFTKHISIKVYGFNGSDEPIWSKEFDPNDPSLDSIEIVVSLQRPNALIPLDKDAAQDRSKKLRGKITQLDDNCSLKDLTVIVKARDVKEIWHIVGVASTDCSGNFSMAYPFGAYTEAEAIVSLKPNHPAAISINDDRTISDKFLYLLLQDVDCRDSEKDEDCDCESPKKASRLPDYEDLIESDEYTQDIGGSCVNLSTPNRTLSEFNYQAIVRTSDPEVANYTLIKKVSDQSTLDAFARLSAQAARAAQVARAAHNAQVAQIAQTAQTAQANRAAPVARAAKVAQAAQVARTAQAIKVAKANLDAQVANAAVQAAQDAADAHTAKYKQDIEDQWANRDPNKNNYYAQLIKDDLAAVPLLLAKITQADMVAQPANTAAQAAKAILDDLDVKNSRAAQSVQEAFDAQAVQAVLDDQITQDDLDALDAQDAQDVQAALDAQVDLDRLARSISLGTIYELVGGGQNGAAESRQRKPITLDNPVVWQDAPDDKKNVSMYQAVTIATGHILHYKSLFKADGYSLGDLIYSLPLAPGQKKEIVTFDASHTLQGAESQSLSQAERLSAVIDNERGITNKLGGSISEKMRGSSFANTSGISAGFGTGGSGSGSAGGSGSGSTGGYGGSGSAVLGVAGGVANANSNASQDSSRDVSQFFGEKLRQSIMQNAESYRQLNASVVTTVQEGQRYGVISEVVANHNHCHALTMMYFEVLRHYAIFQELSGVEECVFVPLLLTNFTTQNIYKWRDVLAQFLLPMPSETYLQESTSTMFGRPHPLLKAFDANERIKTQYANVDFPQGSYDDERIRFIKGEMRLRVELPRPKTRYDRIMSLPITTKGIDPAEMAAAGVDYATNMALYAAKTALTGGFLALFEQPPTAPGIKKTIKDEVLEREKIFDSFMSLDANYQSVPPAQCIRVTNFSPPAPISVTWSPGSITFKGGGVVDFFAENTNDKEQWTAYAAILGFPDVLTMLNAYFRGNLISEWDDIFYNQMAPVIFEKIVSSIGIKHISTDFSSETKYRGGEKLVRLNLHGTTSKKRNELSQLKMSVDNSKIQSLKPYVTLAVEDVTILYSTSHYNGMLFSGNLKDDLLDDTTLYTPMNSEEQRNPKKEDAYLVYKLIEHLNSNLEHYNKVLWYNLDPDRRYMLLDGFNIQVFNDSGRPFDKYRNPLPPRSLASVVKNDLITVSGNSLVFPVAAGYKVSQDNIVIETEDRKDKKRRVTLLDHYQPLTPIKPYRISVPSKGVFAEAVQGACNACEEIERNRLQDWNKFPNTDEPTAISPITPPTVAITDWKAAFKDFATPMVNIQNAPAAPAPGAGLAGLSELLGQSGVFKDITGLDANQRNVLQTYLSNQDNAKAFAQMAKEMAMQSHNTQNSGNITDSLKEAKDAGALSQEEYNKLTKDHIGQQIDGGQTKQAELEKEKRANPSALTTAGVGAINRGQAVEAKTPSEDWKISSGNPENVLAGFYGDVPNIKQTKHNDCWAVCATMMTIWKEQTPRRTVEEVVTSAGQKYLQIYLIDKGMFSDVKDDFLSHLEMIAEKPHSLSLKQYIDMVNTYGPIWITTDSNKLPGYWSPHARILTKITGTGTPDGTNTKFTFIDPSVGRETTVTFAEFLTSYEQMAKDDKSENLSSQIVHFIDTITSKPEGYNVGFDSVFDRYDMPAVHEMMTLAALVKSTMAIPATTRIGNDQATNEFLRGAYWNDDPDILLFKEDRNNNYRQTNGSSWGLDFTAKDKATNQLNLTGRSHFGNLQFLHAMASKVGELPQDTLAKILLWTELAYKLSIREGVFPSNTLASVSVSSSVSSNTTTYNYSLAKFFGEATKPLGTDTLNYLLTQNSRCASLDISRRAIGSLLHLIQDSFAKGHVKRTLQNPGDTTYGKYGDVVTFHTYSGQDEKQHSKFDAFDTSLLDIARLETFNELIGARDAINYSIKLLDFWRARTPYASPGGPKDMFENEIFKLSATVTVANANVD